MPLKLRFIAITLLMLVVSVIYSPMEEENITLTLLYWLIKGCICITASLAIEACWSWCLQFRQPNLSVSLLLVCGEWFVVALVLTIVDIPLEGIMPLTADYRDSFSLFEFFEETLIHWIVLLPLVVISMLTNPLYSSLHVLFNLSEYTSHTRVRSAPLAVENNDRSTLPTNEIVRIEASEHYVLVYFLDGKDMVKSSFSAYLRKINTAEGMQVHRSHWVNVNYVRGLEKSGRKLYIVMANNDKLPVSNSFKDQVVHHLSLINSNT